jgi:hypothetical protein
VQQEIQTLAPQLAQLEQLAPVQPQVQALRQRLLVLEQRLTSVHRACATVCGVAAPGQPGPAGSASGSSVPLTTPQPGTRLPSPLIARHLNAALAGAAVRIHNYQSQGSFLRFGPALGNQQVNFAVGEGTYTHPMSGPVHYWLNDLNAAGLTVTAEGAYLVARLHAESQGTEIVVQSQSPLVPRGVDVNDGGLILTLSPALDQFRHPSYNVVSVRFSAQYACQGTGFAEAVCALLRAQLTEFANASVAQQVAQVLARPDLRERVGSTIWAGITSLAGRREIEQATGKRINTIRGVHVDSQGFVLDHD